MSAARWCLLAVVLTACGSPRRAPVSDEVLLDPTRRPRVAEFEPAFEALAAALADGDDASANGILSRVRALRPEGPAAEVAEAFGRMLEGRSLARELELRLVAERRERGEGASSSAESRGSATRRLSLVAVSRHATRVTLHAAAARVESLMFGIDVRGFEHRSASTRATGALTELALAPDDPEVVELQEFEVPLTNELALRAHFELVLVQAEIEIDGRRLPAANLRVGACEVDRLAAFLPTGAVEPAEFASYLARPGFALPPALERAVRIAPERREEALALCAPVIASLNRIDLERATPCLRWLSGDRERGGDPDRWRAWAEARLRREDAPPTLDLPAAEREPAPPRS
jgi:hypothetical protein